MWASTGPGALDVLRSLLTQLGPLRWAQLGSAPSCRVGGLFGLAQPVLWVKAPSFPPEALAESEVPRQIRAGYCSLVLCPKSPWLPLWSLALGREVLSPPELLPQSLRFQPPYPPPIQAATCTPSVTDGLEHSLLLDLVCAFLSRTLSFINRIEQHLLCTPLRGHVS